MNPHNKFEDMVLKQWLVRDDALFQACGFCLVAASDDQSVFITWDKYYLLNIRFKMPEDSCRIKMTAVRIPVPKSDGGYIRSVHAMRHNTILHMSNGELYSFTSFKALSLIKWLSAVRCLAIVDVGFSVIRIESRRLLLQTYVDLPDWEKDKCTLQHTFDITFDQENLFQSDWQHNEYTLTTLKVTEKEEEFVRSLFGTHAAEQNYVHIFSIGGHVFALAYNLKTRSDSTGPDYNIELLCIYAAHVKFIKLLPIENLCLIFLSSGSIDIWYTSRLLSIKQRQIFHTGSEWLDYDATSGNGDVYYTDGNQLVRLRFKYNAQLDECFVYTLTKPVSGIYGCCWIDQKEELFCLSENNTLYCIAFGMSEMNDQTLRNSTPSLATSSLMRLQHNAEALQEYKKHPDSVRQKLYKEYKQQQLISMIKNIRRVNAPIKTSLEYHLQVPFDIVRDNVLLQAAQSLDLDQKSSIYAVLNVRLIDSRPLLQRIFWKLLTYYDNRINVLLLPTEIVVNKKCCMVVALSKMKNEHLPHFKMQLLQLVELNQQSCAVIFQVPVESSGNSFRAIFSRRIVPAKYTSNNEQLMQRKPNISKIRQASSLRSQFTFCNIADLFCNAVSINNDYCKLHFIDEKLHFHLNGMLESKDASAIYYFKQHIILNSDQLEPASKEYNMIFNSIMSDVDRFRYRQCNDILACGTNFANLKSKYKIIRNDIH
ncbi:uncharacterized protein LOC6739541 [Drosophila simulans]|uniref:GD17705 n=1 Tax=Drosophila simulans TaxID=7240 RepID=B4NST6_DROSI|nr:uncharacterized protein LOC6739541 [Drosophila simulans]EDX15268.1 GD17705 [Drosophila simulans]KMY91436.1 uncharacterized protein Dsimw501_GD17705 [Drosophila simulans]